MVWYDQLLFPLSGLEAYLYRVEFFPWVFSMRARRFACLSVCVSVCPLCLCVVVHRGIGEQVLTAWKLRFVRVVVFLGWFPRKRLQTRTAYRILCPQNAEGRGRGGCFGMVLDGEVLGGSCHSEQ